MWLHSNDEGDLETLALQLGEGFPLLVEGAMDEKCWTVAKALARNSIIFQGVVEHLTRTHFTGCEREFSSANENTFGVNREVICSFSHT